MNFSFKITPYYSGAKAAIYTVIFDGEDQSEFDKFLSNPNVNADKDFDNLFNRINDIVERFGPRQEFFKDEGSVDAISYGNLRLYCCRYSGTILIIGSGGIKKTRTFQEDPFLNKNVKILSKVSKLIDDRIIKKEICINDRSFEGNLIFKKDD